LAQACEKGKKPARPHDTHQLLLKGGVRTNLASRRAGRKKNRKRGGPHLFWVSSRKGRRGKRRWREGNLLRDSELRVGMECHWASLTDLWKTNVKVKGKGGSRDTRGLRNDTTLLSRLIEVGLHKKRNTGGGGACNGGETKGKKIGSLGLQLREAAAEKMSPNIPLKTRLGWAKRGKRRVGKKHRYQGAGGEAT